MIYINKSLVQKSLKFSCLLIMCLMLIDCSSENSSWMQNSNQAISNKTISQITLPGAHYANAYGISKNSTLCNGELLPQSMSNNARIMLQLNENDAPTIQEDIFISTLNTQDNDILHQLDQGVRYLELSICLQDSKFYTSNLYLTEELRKISKQVNTFIHAHPAEIVILDLDSNLRAENGFMNSQDIVALHDELVEEFGNSIIPKDKLNNSIGQLVDEHHQIIIMTSDSALSAYPDIWNKNNVVFTADATYPTIKKISLLSSYFENTSNYTTGKFAILPVYSETSYDVLTPEMYETDQDQEIVINYLQHHIGIKPGIIVGSKTNIQRINQIIIKQTLNLANSTSPTESGLTPESSVALIATESSPISSITSESIATSTNIISTPIPTPTLNPYINASTPQISLPK